MSQVSTEKASKQYLIVTQLEKFNVNDKSDLIATNGIREEIDADHDKTHYPLPLSFVQIHTPS